MVRLVCPLLLALGLVGPPALAEPEISPELTDELRVKEGFRTAEALRKSGDLTGALAVLRMTYERVPTPFLLWPIAELSLQLRQPLAGLQALAEYAEKVPPPEQPEPGQPSAAQVAWLRGRLLGQVARLEVRADEAGALVMLDGRQIGRAPLPGPVEVDPGRHQVEARGAGRDVAEVVLQPGERRAVALRTAATPRPRRDPRVPARWGLWGLGAVSLVLGGGLLGEHGACVAAGTCTGDLRTPGAALLGAGAGLLGAATLLIGLEVLWQGGGKKGWKAVLGRF